MRQAEPLLDGWECPLVTSSASPCTNWSESIPIHSVDLKSIEIHSASAMKKPVLYKTDPSSSSGIYTLCQYVLPWCIKLPPSPFSSHPVFSKSLFFWVCFTFSLDFYTGGGEQESLFQWEMNKIKMYPEMAILKTKGWRALTLFLRSDNH